MRRSFWPSVRRKVGQWLRGDGEVVAGVLLFPFPKRRSRQAIRRIATFHSKPSCSLKNSRKAGSSFSCDSSLGVRLLSLVGETAIDCLRFSTGVVPEPERQICARRPSSWRRPLRILPASKEER
jgi:hypothetical protein